MVDQTDCPVVPIDRKAMRRDLRNIHEVMCGRFRGERKVSFIFEDSPPRIYVLYGFHPDIRQVGRDFLMGRRNDRGEWDEFGRLVCKVNQALMGENRIIRGKGVISYPIGPLSGDLDGEQMAVAFGLRDDDYPVREIDFRYSPIQGL